MRNLIFGINLSLDGCCDHSKLSGSEAIHEYFTNIIQAAGLLVYGRKTYQLMVPYWPDVAKNKSGQTTAENEFAQTFDAIKKVVFSHTLENAEDKNTRIVRTDLREEILKLKKEPGNYILAGGVALPTQLIELGLVDEYYFVIHPIIAGEGRRLLESTSLPAQLQLQLIESTTLKSGEVALHYVKQ